MDDRDAAVAFERMGVEPSPLAAAPEGAVEDGEMIDAAIGRFQNH